MKQILALSLTLICLASAMHFQLTGHAHISDNSSDNSSDNNSGTI